MKIKDIIENCDIKRIGVLKEGYGNKELIYTLFENKYIFTKEDLWKNMEKDIKPIKKEHHHHIQIPKLTYYYTHDENGDKSKSDEQEDQE